MQFYITHSYLFPFFFFFLLVSVFFFYFVACVESNLFSLQMAQGEIHFLYKHSLQIEYLHLKKQTEGRNRAPTANEEEKLH